MTVFKKVDGFCHCIFLTFLCHLRMMKSQAFTGTALENIEDST